MAELSSGVWSLLKSWLLLPWVFIVYVQNWHNPGKSNSSFGQERLNQYTDMSTMPIQTLHYMCWSQQSSSHKPIRLPQLGGLAWGREILCGEVLYQLSYAQLRTFGNRASQRACTLRTIIVAKVGQWWRNCDGMYSCVLYMVGTLVFTVFTTC